MLPSYQLYAIITLIIQQLGEEVIIYLLLRLTRVGQLALPHKAFLATYSPSSEPEREQSERERNAVRLAVWKLRR